jgi:hypothetical protein
MTPGIRILSTLFILWLCIFQIPSAKAGALILLFLFIVSLDSSIRTAEIFRRNLVVLSFIIFYSVFGTITVFTAGGSYYTVSLISLKIILIFNIIWLSLRWLGTNGILCFMKAIPSEKIRLYLMLVAKGILVFKRNSDMIVMQIRSRLEPGRKSRGILVRYYIRNMIFRDIYSLHYLQAALYSRLPERLSVHTYGIKTGTADRIITIAIILYISAVYIMEI